MWWLDRVLENQWVKRSVFLAHMKQVEYGSLLVRWSGEARSCPPGPSRMSPLSVCSRVLHVIYMVVRKWGRAAPSLCEKRVLMLFCSGLAFPGRGGWAALPSAMQPCVQPDTLLLDEGQDRDGVSWQPVPAHRFSAVDQRFVVCLDNLSSVYDNSKLECFVMTT